VAVERLEVRLLQRLGWPLLHQCLEDSAHQNKVGCLELRLPSPVGCLGLRLPRAVGCLELRLPRAVGCLELRLPSPVGCLELRPCQRFKDSAHQSLVGCLELRLPLCLELPVHQSLRVGLDQGLGLRLRRHLERQREELLEVDLGLRLHRCLGERLEVLPRSGLRLPRRLERPRLEDPAQSLKRGPSGTRAVQRGRTSGTAQRALSSATRTPTRAQLAVAPRSQMQEMLRTRKMKRPRPRQLRTRTALLPRHQALVLSVVTPAHPQQRINHRVQTRRVPLPRKPCLPSQHPEMWWLPTCRVPTPLRCGRR
jgi:hypothetical protein